MYSKVIPIGMVSVKAKEQKYENRYMYLLLREDWLRYEIRLDLLDEYGNWVESENQISMSLSIQEKDTISNGKKNVLINEVEVIVSDYQLKLINSMEREAQ